MCFFFVVFCLFLRFSRDLLLLASVISEVAQRCTVFAHFGNMSSFFASVLSTITKLVLCLLIHVCDFRYSKKGCQRTNSGTSAPIHICKKLRCVSGHFSFPRVVEVLRSLRPTSWFERLSMGKARNPPTPSTTLRRGAEVVQRRCRRKCKGGCTWGCMVCVCLCVCVGEGRGGGRGEASKKPSSS